MGIVREPDVLNAIRKIEFHKLGAKTTVGIATLVNGFEIVEHSSCVDERKYNQAIGENIVKERIHHKVWELLGFKSQDVKAQNSQTHKPAELSPDDEAAAFNA